MKKGELWFMQTDLLLCFLSDGPKKEELLKSNLGYQILSRRFPNNRHLHQYSDFAFFCYSRNITFDLSENC